MATVQVDNDTKQAIEQLARKERRTESEIVREMSAAYRFSRALTKIQDVATAKFKELGITTIDEAEHFLG
jgi:predicted transcriptional regulator